MTDSIQQPDPGEGLRVTTTHAEHGSGGPRLVRKSEDLWEGEVQPEFWLTARETTVGSAEGCDITLVGLAEHHLTVRHSEDDEYRVVNVGPEVRVHGAVVVQDALLRTGARIDAGDHQLTFFREEYADHSRPFGGRVGGEAGQQLSQPPRRSSERPATG